MKVVSNWDLNEIVLLMEGETIYINGYVVLKNSICVNGSIVFDLNEAKLLQKELTIAVRYCEKMDRRVASVGTDSNSCFVKFFRYVSWFVWRRWIN